MTKTKWMDGWMEWRQANEGVFIYSNKNTWQQDKVFNKIDILVKWNKSAFQQELLTLTTKGFFFFFFCKICQNISFFSYKIYFGVFFQIILFLWRNGLIVFPHLLDISYPCSSSLGDIVPSLKKSIERELMTLFLQMYLKHEKPGRLQIMERRLYEENNVFIFSVT